MAKACIHLAVVTTLACMVEGLRRIHVNPVSDSATTSPEEFSQREEYIYVSTDKKGSSFKPARESELLLRSTGSVQAAETTSHMLEEDTRVIYKKPNKKKKRKKGKKKMRKVKVKPRGGRHIKETFQNLRPWNTQIFEEEKHRAQSSSEISIKPEVVYSTPAETGYSQEELLRLCEETKNIGTKFGIYNLSSFAGNNCALIRLYYPEVTCEQIKVFLEYCQSAGAI